MLKRYTQLPNGTLIQQAKIYTRNEHGIDVSQIDSDALAIIKRLRVAGFESYIVGGAVRDIILGKTPKDFDLSTNAHPAAIRKIFRNSRIIGRRFRLVHIFFRNGKIIEVSTFRNGNNNIYGTLEEDVQRRDFTINALYYDPIREHLIDFLDGFENLKKLNLRSPIPLSKIFLEDPVRIIRGIKYKAVTGATPNRLLQRQMKNDAHLLKNISQSRITEEVYKILMSGYSQAIIYDLEITGIIRYILPNFELLLGSRYTGTRWIVGGKRRRSIKESLFYEHLQNLDSNETTSRTECIQWFIHEFVLDLKKQNADYSKICEIVKKTLEPICPPNKDIEDSVSIIISSLANK